MSEVLPQPLFAETIYEDDVLSVAHVALSGLNGWVINHRSKMEYEVLSGSGFLIAGDKMHNLKRGEKVTILPGIPYRDGGTHLDMLATAWPPFDIDTVEFVE